MKNYAYDSERVAYCCGHFADYAGNIAFKKAKSEENGMYDVEMVSDSVREKIARIETRIEKEVGVGCSQEELAQMRAEARRRKKREEER